MARGEWGNHGRGKVWGRCCPYKKTTLLFCSFNFLVTLYVLRSLYVSLYIHNNDSQIVSYTPDQIMKMEDSIRIRRAFEPVELIKLVNQLKNEYASEELVIELPHTVQQKIIDEILQTLRSLNTSMDDNKRREAIDSWRKEKLKEIGREALNLTILPEESGMLERALQSNWEALLEEIGIWIPAEIINKEHDDKPEGEEEFDDEILPGRPLPPECNAELHTDYDGAAVRWGLTHHKESAADCCQACLDHAKRANPGEKKCNIWVYCPAEGGCYSPDIYEHKQEECWLKFAEKPRVNFKDSYSESYRNSHPNAPTIVPWVSGVVST